LWVSTPRTISSAEAINQLKAILVGADPALRESMTGLAQLP